MTTITINGISYTLVTMPSSPGPASAEIGMNDAVAVVRSPFTGQEQAQAWFGADFWEATVTLPPMTKQQAAPWRAFFAQLRGRLNVFQLSDPAAWAGISGYGTPVVNGAGSLNVSGGSVLYTRGWTASQATVIKAGQQFQVDYRLYMACADFGSDSSGNAQIEIFPTLREVPTDGTALNLSNPAGLFRLADNRRAFSWSPRQAMTTSFRCMEAR